MQRTLLTQAEIKKISTEIRERYEAYECIYDPELRTPWAYDSIRKDVYRQHGFTGDEKMIPCFVIG